MANPKNIKPLELRVLQQLVSKRMPMEQRAAMLATLLRDGPSERFVCEVADLLDPRKKKSELELVVRASPKFKEPPTNPGRPKGEANYVWAHKVHLLMECGSSLENALEVVADEVDRSARTVRRHYEEFKNQGS